MRVEIRREEQPAPTPAFDASQMVGHHADPVTGEDTLFGIDTTERTFARLKIG